jgi:hypothetical protein
MENCNEGWLRKQMAGGTAKMSRILAMIPEGSPGGEPRGIAGEVARAGVWRRTIAKK